MERSDRYEPLPGLAQLPAFLLRKLSPRGRRVAAALGGLLLVGALAGAAFGLPALERSREERAAASERAAAEARARQAAALRAELRLRRGRGTPARGLDGAAAITARRALAVDLELAVERDAAQRTRTGEFERPVQRVTCERYPRGARGEEPATDLASPTGRYSCLAVTRLIEPTATTPAGLVGYPYRAQVHFPSGRFTYCKISGRPGEGSTMADFPVRVPRACGGT